MGLKKNPGQYRGMIKSRHDEMLKIRDDCISKGMTEKEVYETVGKAIGFSWGSVKHYLLSRGIKQGTGRGPKVWVDHEKVKSLLASGMQPKCIAAECGCSESHVSNIKGGRVKERKPEPENGEKTPRVPIVKADYTDRGDKRKFLKYMDKNPSYLSSVFPKMTAEQAWKQTQGINWRAQS